MAPGPLSQPQLASNLGYFDQHIHDTKDTRIEDGKGRANFTGALKAISMSAWTMGS